MRIAKLDLLAYGPFRGLSLDFSAPGLHVVLGRNEAGKSTTLRAITGLLYGIETKTPDAHVHKPNELRIGGTLESPSGERVRVVRRKGLTNTLLDQEGEAIDEVVLKRLLGGVSEDVFRNAFGLDHAALGAGAQALLEGRGDLGESLFGASVGGGRDVQELVKRLSNDADKLYRPGGKNPLVNEALSAFNAAQKTVRERQSLPEAFITQEKALHDAEEEKRTTIAKRACLVLRKAELDRARKRVPLERRRDRAKATLAEMGLLAERTAQIEGLRGRSELYDRALDERKRLALEVERLKERALQAKQRAGIAGDATTDLRLEAKKEVRATTLVHERTRLTTSIEQKRTEVARLEREIERLRATIVDAPNAKSAIDGAALERALSAAVALGDAEARLASERAKNERRRKDLVMKARALGLFEGTLDELVALRLPQIATIDALLARANDADKKTVRLEERAAALEVELASVERQIAEQSGELAPPDLAALRAAREARDDAYAKKVAVAKYEKLVHEADAIADQMIREADRVTNLARLRSTKETATKQYAQLAQEIVAAKKARALIDDEHRKVFAASKLDPLGFAEMRAWLARHEQIVDAVSQLKEAEASSADEEKRIATARADLARVLGTKDDATLAALVAEGARHAKSIVEATRTLDETKKTLAKCEIDLDGRTAVLAREEAALADTCKKLDEILGPLGIESEASHDEINAGLDALREVFDVEDKRMDAETRARAADLEVRELDATVAAIVAELAPDLAGRPTQEALISLTEKARAAVKTNEELAAVTEQLEALGDAPISDEIAALVNDPTALDELEHEIDELEHEISKLDQAIGGRRDGLQKMQADSNAAEAAIVREQALARLRDGVERWCKAKLAAVVLAKEIERYREENEGPLIAGAAKLFSRLTLGAFAGVKSGFDDRDKPCLRCVRSSGAEVDVTGLSEGTRDQLYLSLRLATLVRRADAADPMPLVLDDVLIQLDDERAGAALSVLAEVARKMQVLFFTHHARLVDIAKRAVPKDELVIHDLDAVSRQGSLFASSPA